MKTLSKSNGGQQSLTTESVHAAPAYVAGQDPEFLDARGVFARFGIRRSLLYAIKEEGRIRTVALRRKGACV
ncbi:MAG TPA: hypothetical protein VFU37_16070 [Pyrinomonadaceae bacterium]|nr:hypothetical protein [Pyrinomonadaceae bacterium]